MFEYLLLGALVIGYVVIKVVACKKPKVDAPAPLPEGAAGWLSTTVLEEIANPQRLYSLRYTGQGRLKAEAVAANIQREGDYGIITICVDPRGMIALKDGHHRLLAAKENHVDRLPVRLRQSKAIKSHGKHITELLPSLLKETGTRQDRVSTPDRPSGEGRRTTASPRSSATP